MTKLDHRSRRFAKKTLSDFAARALAALGFPASDAEVVAELIVRADVLGSDSHGIFRLKQYLDEIRDETIKTNPNIRIERETNATAVVDGDSGFGHLTMKFASELAIAKARINGAAWVGVNHGNLAGPGAIWVREMLTHDMIGIYGAVGGNNLVPPWGGTERLLGSNPIAFAVPGLQEPPIVLDMATTVASNGNIQLLAQQGKTMPQGWMIDKEGRPLTDPTRAREGFLLPIGGAKGYGLALMVGLLGGVLNGAAMGRDVNSGEPNIGQFIAAISIEAFIDVDTFKHNVDEVARAMRGSARMPGVEAVRVPGDGSHSKQQDRLVNGIPIHDSLYATLNQIAAELRIEPLG